MKRTLVGLLTLIALAIGIPSFASCPCPCTDPCNPCVKPCDPCASPCDPCNSCDCGCPYDPCACCEKWLDCKCIEDYLCRIGLNECQKCDARKAIEEFKCATQGIRSKNCKCETKCECRCYRKALRDLDCKMKTILNKCQNTDYKCVKKEVQDQVRCCHKCLINPFKRCKCCK